MKNMGILAAIAIITGLVALTLFNTLGRSNTEDNSPSNDTSLVNSTVGSIVESKDAIEDNLDSVSNTETNLNTSTSDTEVVDLAEEEVTTPAVLDEVPASTAITAEVVAEHNTKDDCWTIVTDKVYDITSYIPNHPGGAIILSACGADGTAMFIDGGGHAGTGHSPQAIDLLESYFVSDLEV